MMDGVRQDRPGWREALKGLALLPVGLLVLPDDPSDPPPVAGDAQAAVEILRSFALSASVADQLVLARGSPSLCHSALGS